MNTPSKRPAQMGTRTGSPKIPRPRKIPVYPLSEYGSEAAQGAPFFVGRFEESSRLAPKRLRLHRHDFHEVFWLMGRGRFFCDFQEYTIASPTLVFVSPGQIHSWTPSPSLAGPMICFSQSFHDGAEPPPSSLLGLPFWFSGEAPPLLAVSPGDVAKVDSLWAELAAEASGSEENREEILRLRLRLLLQTAARIFRRTKPDSHPATRPNQALAHQFRMALETHFCEARSIPAYARMLKSTAGHLSESVLQHTGRTAGELIRERLLLEAQRLLIHSSMNVAEIAVALQFEDPSYFSRFFRRGTRMSPGEFRDQFLKKYPN
jgi:AraC family transcriptional regulator, transcriptional activator of pobA